MSEVVKFTKLRTITDPTFWIKFAELKIDELKLDDTSKVHLWGNFSLQPMDEGRINPLILDYTSFNEKIELTSHNVGVARYGYMINTNIHDTFKNINPETLIDTMGKCIIDSIIDGSALTESWRLTVFVMFAYSDLKRYRFHYWVAHPTPFFLPEIYLSQLKYISDEFTTSQIDKLREDFLQLDAKSRNFFTIFISEEGDLNIGNLMKGVEYAKLNADNKENSKQTKDKMYFAYYDPCPYSQRGWPLRNLLCLLLWHCPAYCFKYNIKILCIKNDKIQTSVILALKIQDDIDMETVRKNISEGHLVGWETNNNGKMGPNIADLSNSMDPTKLSDKAINLNLKLMKWRLAPNLDLNKITIQRCLLLGAGTLGCSVARVLLAWGVNNVTFVDNSTVSHSNIVRQNLYTHEDAVQRRYKAYAAKDALLKIRPNMNVEGVVLHIPMPGHVIGESMMETSQEALSKLEELINSHDIVFLLLDSREARWLPTLLCAALSKIAINAALGFDSYTVQRHGTRDILDPSTPNLAAQNLLGQDLGCYFCNDVTQPGNSQLDRTLDQQCTVSRPGLSQIAAGLAVELFVAIMQHPKGISVKAFMNEDSNNSRKNIDNAVGLLGGVPHTIRGSLWCHEMVLTVTHRFPLCTACSVPLIKEYRQRGFAFILDACNVPNYLAKLSGLEEILNRPHLDELCYALSDDETENASKAAM